MPKFGVGQAVTRTEDQRFLTGQGRYTDDMTLPNQAHAVILRSPHAHARFTITDTSAAAASPGVVAILTNAELRADGVHPIPCLAPITNKDGTPIAATVHEALAENIVRHVGDCVAMVVAETKEQARDAAELIEVDYDALPATTDTVASTKPGAPLVWDTAANNICFDWGRGDKDATDAAFAKADHVTEITLVNNRVVVNSMEGRGALGDYDPQTDRMTLYTSSQGPHFLLDVLADAIFKIAKEKIRVVSGDVGGGFGMKIFAYPEQPLVMWAARRLGRPVKWISERSEAFVSDVHGRDNVTRAELAMDAQGHFLGLRATTYANMGGYLSNMGPFIPTVAGTSMLAGLYMTPAIYVNVLGIMTHTVPVDAYRGAGRPEAIYVIERVVDKAARELGLSPQEIRGRNFIPTDKLPYTTPLDETYDSGEFAAIMDRGMAQADWEGFEARREAAKQRGKLLGIGMSTYVETCGGGPPEQANIKFADNRDELSIYIGTLSNGQGHETAYKQILSERLDLDADAIILAQGDSDLTPPGFTGGSRSVTNGGVAVDKVGQAIIDKGRQIAAQVMETAAADIEYADATFTIAGTDRGMSLFEVARAAKDPANLPEGVTPGLDEQYKNIPDASTYPNGCHVCEIEIDPDTGTVAITRYSVVDDFGDVINPLLLEGQVHGGIVQGVGQALHERTVYSDDGQLLTGSFMDYTMPRADDFPTFNFSTRNIRCVTNPLGIKGSGEAGAIGAPPAIINAIVDALQPRLGLVDVDMPATAQVIWDLLHPAEAA